MQQSLNAVIDETVELLPRIRLMAPALIQLGEMLETCWHQGGKVLMCGNGGSMADAMHFAEELSVRYRRNRRALAAIALSDSAVITCAGNDLGFEMIFARQVEALGRAADLLVIMSTSGRSANIVRAVQLAKEMGMKTAAFTGNDGGELAALCDLELRVPSTHTARIQEIHKLLFHVVCEWVDARV